MDTCKEENCGGVVHAKGLCQPHYRQNARRERGLKPPGPKRDPSKPYSKFRPPKLRELSTHCGRGHKYTETNTRPCKVCTNLRASKYRLIEKYGLTPERLKQMLVAQDYGCAICPEKFDLDAKYPFDVDHDHNCCSGEKTCGDCIRGILCRSCNRGLGAFKDNMKYLQSAIEYLDR